MTISSSTNKAQYLGNGTTTDFSFPNVFFDDTDLDVTLFNTTTDADVIPAPVLNGGATYDYTISGVFDVTKGEYVGGADVVFNTAPPANYRVTILRVVPSTQDVTLIDNSKFPAETVNTEFDKLTVLMQQVAGMASRALVIPDSDPSSIDPTLPPALSRALMFLAFDALGNPIASTGATSTGTPFTAFGEAWVASSSQLTALGYINVKFAPYGAAGDGVTDDTAAIQAALTAAGAAGKVFFPPGTYLVSATLQGYPNQTIMGAGVNSTMIYRTGNYGDTMLFGTTLAGANAIHISGIWFQHSVDYVSGSGQTTIANLATSGAHIHAVNMQGGLIDHCWFGRLPYTLHLDGASLSTVRNCNMTCGPWDPVNVGCQEGLESIYLNTASRNNTIILIEGCSIGGFISSARTLSYTTSDLGVVTMSAGQPVGAQHGIRNLGCEDLCFSNNYIGGFSSFNFLCLFAAGSANFGYRLHNSFWDGSGAVSSNGSQIYIANAVDAAFLNGLTITGNTFNGEVTGMWQIVFIGAGTNEVVKNFVIANNVFQASVATPIYLLSAIGGLIMGNNISGYNGANLSLADSTYVAAVLIASNSSHISIGPNRLGGAVNTNEIASSRCYQGVVVAASVTLPGSIMQFRNDSSGTGASGASYGKQDKNISVVTSAVNYQTTGSEDVLIISNSAGAGIDVDLPLIKIPGQTITIKDGSGVAGANNLTVKDLTPKNIDGAGTSVINANYGSRTFCWNGTQWNVID